MTMDPDLLLQRIVLPTRVETAGLYWRHEGPVPRARISADIPPACSLDLDTYFNSFDENVWRRHTRLETLAVELQIAGPARVELWRHSRAAPPALIAEAEGSEGTLRLNVPPLPHPRAAGRLGLRVLSDGRLGAGAKLLGGRWKAAQRPTPIRVMPVICTYDRDPQLRTVLTRLAADRSTMAAIAGVIVINNGAPGLSARLLGPGGLPHPANWLHIVEQDNVGGAGGFTRGLLEARARGATHAILMDDDVEIEPEAVLRTVRLYQLAREEMAVAGHMLDLFRPTHLYEGGARLDDARLSTVPLHLGAELSHAGGLSRFLDETPMHYNGWWFMGVPISVLDRIGYPMPCFIRGDDVEFGRRLHDAGVRHVSTPGIGIWHEPFYAKLGGWHAYYEFRNMIVLAACHLPNPGRRLCFIACKWITAELLMFRYQRAALLIRAVQDFLGGPSIYARNPREVHASLARLRSAWPIGTLPREAVTRRPPPERGPRNRVSFIIQLARAICAEWWRADGGARVIAVEPQDHIWFRVRGADAVVVREAWEIDHPVYRRSRAAFRSLLIQTTKLAWQMRDVRAVVTAWRKAHATFTSEAAWLRMLDCEGELRAAGAGRSRLGEMCHPPQTTRHQLSDALVEVPS